jgi:hypothetical protein
MLVAGLSAASSASAAVFTWGGSNANWGTNGSWVNNAQPATGDSVLFKNLGSGTDSTVNISRTLADITFGASANRSFTLKNNNTYTTTLGSLINASSFNQTVNNNISLSSASGVIDTGAAGITLGSKLTGTGTYSKIGSGLLEVSNGNASPNFTGTLSVNAGSMKLTTGLTAATVIVNSGATLYGANNFTNGYVGSLVVNEGGTLTPGDNGYGGIQVANNTTLNGQTTLGVGSLSSFDNVFTTGTTTFGGALTISMDYIPTTFGTSSPYFLDGDSWALFSTSETGTFTGDFQSITMTGTYGTVNFHKISADVWQSDYLENGQQFNFYVNSVNGGVAGTLYAVPEPSTIVFAGIGMAMFGWSTRSRRRAKARGRAIEASIA